MTTTDALELLPLTPVAFEILLSLSGEDRHGYAIMRAVDVPRVRRACTLEVYTEPWRDWSIRG